MRLRVDSAWKTRMALALDLILCRRQCRGGLIRICRWVRAGERGVCLCACARASPILRVRVRVRVRAGRPFMQPAKFDALMGSGTRNANTCGRASSHSTGQWCQRVLASGGRGRTALHAHRSGKSDTALSISVEGKNRSKRAALLFPLAATVTAWPIGLPLLVAPRLCSVRPGVWVGIGWDGMRWVTVGVV